MFHNNDYVYEVYKTKSFSKAASNLYISQPSLSATIKKIETDLGFPIFDRSTTPIGLTDSGQKYVEYIERIQDMENEFENYLNDLDQLNQGHLSIGGSNLFASYILPPYISEFMKKFPKINIRLVEDNTKKLEKQLFAGDLDLVIDNYTFSREIYESHFFCKEHLLLAVPAAYETNGKYQDRQLTCDDIKAGKHLLNTTPAVSLKKFKKDPFVLLRSGNDTRERSDQLIKKAGIEPTVLLKLDQQVTAYHIACYGMGITFITDTLAKEVPHDPRIIYYRLDDPGVKRNIHFYHKKTKYITRAMEEFLAITCKEEG